MKRRLKSLLHRWAESESIRSAGRGLRIPDAGYVWIKDKLGRYHCGSFDRYGRFLPLQASFVLIPGTGRRDYSDADEFGAALRTLDETDQGLIIVGEFGGKQGWRDYLVQIKLSPRRANARLWKAWLALMIECRRRQLV